MVDSELNIVTGAFGFTGNCIARKLLAMGKRVVTLTGKSGSEDELAGKIVAVPFNFEHPDQLVNSLQGATVLYNTYWIRFARGSLTFDKAVQNTKILIKAAKDAGVRKFVHVSITNPSLDSPLPYFKGKAIIEQAIVESGLSYAILRPTVIFGDQGILINNIAWLMRRFSIFAIPGDGEYRLQPISVEDLAELAVTLAAGDDNVIIDAVGPETYTFNDLLQLIAGAVRANTRIVHVHPALVFPFAKLLGYALGDELITWDEIKGLMANLLVSDNPPTGQTLLSEWIARNSDWLGIAYMSELKKHYR